MNRKLKSYRTDLTSTVIGEEASVKGILHSQRSIRVDGTFEGEINSQGEVFIGQNSSVKANIFAKTVIIAGEVVGNIEAIKSLSVLKTGRVYGNISGDELIIAEGGIYKGNVNMDVISSKNAFEGNIKTPLNQEKLKLAKK